jgi:hypothetical protein
MLEFNPDWRFDSPGAISPFVRHGFAALISLCIVGDNAKTVFEHFKYYFATAAGTTASASSSTSWAETDLNSYMSEAATNAPLFIEAFFDALSGHPNPAM